MVSLLRFISLPSAAILPSFRPLFQVHVVFSLNKIVFHPCFVACFFPLSHSFSFALFFCVGCCLVLCPLLFPSSPPSPSKTLYSLTLAPREGTVLTDATPAPSSPSTPSPSLIAVTPTPSEEAFTPNPSAGYVWIAHAIHTARVRGFYFFAEDVQSATLLHGVDGIKKAFVNSPCFQTRCMMPDTFAHVATWTTR